MANFPIPSRGRHIRIHAQVKAVPSKRKFGDPNFSQNNLLPPLHDIEKEKKKVENFIGKELLLLCWSTLFDSSNGGLAIAGHGRQKEGLVPHLTRWWWWFSTRKKALW